MIEPGPSSAGYSGSTVTNLGHRTTKYRCKSDYLSQHQALLAGALTR